MPLIISEISGFIIAMLKKLILGIIIIVFLSIGGLVLFFPLDSFIKKKIEESAGPYISFSTLKIGWNSIKADNVLIKTPAGTDFLKIKQLRLKPSFLGLLRKKLEIKGIELDSPELTIKKAKNGKWVLPEFNRRSAEAEKKKGEGSAMEVIVRSVRVDRGAILFADEVQGARFDLTDVAIDMSSRLSFFSAGKASINASAKVLPSGKISINSKGSMATGNFKGTLSIKDINMILLKPYIKGDVEVKKGRLNLDSNVSLDKGNVTAPSHLNVRGLDIEAKGAIMGVSAPLVIELIKKKGEIDLDFNIWGKYDNLRNDLKESFQKKVLAEVGRTVTSPVEDVMKEIRSLLPGKK